MSALLPTVQARNLHLALVDYLATTFALTDLDAQASLADFLRDEGTGIFKGPWVRLRTPFQPADDGWERHLDWYPHRFVPHRHQAEAFARLSSKPAAPSDDLASPQPTLVTTGTGSGKTEAFLLPILDHVLRAKRLGHGGIKALILYPMNALANDQAKRLTELITDPDDTRLAGVTAAIYTGEGSDEKDRPAPRTRTTTDGLVNDRHTIRSNPPDILLTNYKMLDRLLLRPDDQQLWSKSADSLTYLVLDEFHTYDGAQGTDVAMLLRRLGYTLNRHRSKETDSSTPGNFLGPIVPVATSATLGDQNDPAAMIEFAHTVFGTTFTADSVITESRVDLDRWADEFAADAPPHETRTPQLEDLHAALQTPLPTPSQTPADTDGEEEPAPGLGDLTDDPDALTRAVVDCFVDLTSPTDGTEAGPALADLSPRQLAGLLLSSDQVRNLIDRASVADTTDQLATALVPRTDAGGSAARFTELLVAALSHLRAELGRSFVSVETHLWIRELTRIDRVASAATTYRWGDDGQLVADSDDDDRPALPALYCRHCGRSGWGVQLEPTGNNIAVESNRGIRRARHEKYFRALIHAPAEAESALANSTGERVLGLHWWHLRHHTLDTTPPDAADEDYLDGRILPVITHSRDEEEIAGREDCPSCEQRNSIRWLGSAVATLLSVSLSALFGSDQIAGSEKKALVFTDSVQDAAHRAGFVEARSHTLTLRSVIYAATDSSPLSLDEVVSQLEAQAREPLQRYRLLHPAIVDRKLFQTFWQPGQSTTSAARRAVRRRLLFDLAMEFGVNSRFGRTLEATGAIVAGVDAGTDAALVAVGRRVLDELPQPELPEDGPAIGDAELLTWIRGVLERMRTRGAIHHPWFESFIQSDGNGWHLTGGRNRREGMPSLPVNRSTPAFPRVGPTLTGSRAKDPLLDAVTSTQSWYAQWAGKALGLPSSATGVLARTLLGFLAEQGILKQVSTDSGAKVYSIIPERVMLQTTDLDDLTAGAHRLRCDQCHVEHYGPAATVDQLDGGPCLMARCRGTMHRQPGEDNFYRRLYQSADMTRIIAREHTSLLKSADRLAYEQGFQQVDTPGTPNVLVATPTLEMGIDIGSLSTVFLASLPRTVASYLQRVGRAGRATGNALDVAYASGHRANLPRLVDPLQTINGAVRPPATWLSAEEILCRQYFAHLLDRLAGETGFDPPRSPNAALDLGDENTFLGRVISRAHTRPEELLSEFLSGFDNLQERAQQALRDWATPDEHGDSGLAQAVRVASDDWNSARSQLAFQRREVEGRLPALREVAESPAATSEDEKALQTAEAALRYLKGRQSAMTGRSDWIGALEGTGLLPNYTLLDDSVRLDVLLTWIDPDTQAWQDEQITVPRPSAQALREFPPGATFYVRGMQVRIDAVDLGPDDQAIRRWATCAECGWIDDLGDGHAATACPRCGSATPTDAGQHLSVVELSRVTAQVHRDEAKVDDSSEDRHTTTFTTVGAADIDLRHARDPWFVDGYDFGVAYLSQLTVRWLNVGRRGTGQTLDIAGDQVNAPLFRLCSGCGVQDQVGQVNQKKEHRAWCRYRTANDESHLRSVALSRTLRTQGLMITLPTHVGLGDSFALPSLTAAVLLGLRERYGGDPDHLGVMPTVSPHPEQQNRNALLLHDRVPGGTGYLADLARPDQTWKLLFDAWQIVRDCPCAQQGQLACPQCLLPFAGSDPDSVSRQAAERHLHDILTVTGNLDEPGQVMGWRTTTQQPDAPTNESHLELRFREAFVAMLDERLGATNIVQIPQGRKGNRVKFSLPGQHHTWVLDPQVPMGNSLPDVVLRSDDVNLPQIPIFLDGRRYHASATNNALADDATKRTNLSLAGHLVLGITYQDVLTQQDGAVPRVPRWARENRIQPWLVQHHPRGAASYAAVLGGPFAILEHLLTTADIAGYRTMATYLPMALLGAHFRPQPGNLELGDAARRLLDGGTLTGNAQPAGWWSAKGVGVLARQSGNLVELCALLDDRPARLRDEDSAEGWWDWLALSNALQLGEAPSLVLTRKMLIESPRSGQTASTMPAAEVSRPHGAWGELYDDAGDRTEQELVAALAVEELPIPLQGLEIGADGITADLAWPEIQMAVLIEPADEDRADLETLGWTVVEPNAGPIVAAHRAVAGATQTGEGS